MMVVWKYLLGIRNICLSRDAGSPLENIDFCLFFWIFEATNLVRSDAHPSCLLEEAVPGQVIFHNFLCASSVCSKPVYHVTHSIRDPLLQLFSLEGISLFSGPFFCSSGPKDGSWGVSIGV